MDPPPDPAGTPPSPTAAPLAAFAFVAPWAIVSLLLPFGWMVAALALLLALGLLLTLAARLALRLAGADREDAHFFAFLAVATLGLAVVVLSVTKAPGGHARPHLEFLCEACGRLQDARQAFCYGCGA